MSKLNQEELLAWFAWWQSFCRKDCDSNMCFIAGGDKKRCEQAYQQIRKMIQNHTNLEQSVAQSQGKITEEWIEEKADKLREKCACHHISHDTPYITIDIMEAKDFIRSLIEPTTVDTEAIAKRLAKKYNRNILDPQRQIDKNGKEIK